MAGKNITIAGATFNAVPSIDVPISGGGTASFVEISDTTAQAADVAQGKYFYDAAGIKTEGTASGGGGGGGASNVVTGTFKGTTAGVAMDVDLPYTGSGYPIAVIIYPTGGMAGNSDYSSLKHRYAIAVWSGAKRETGYAPKYTGANADKMSIICTYKSSSTNSASYGNNSAEGQPIYNDTAAESLSTGCVHIRSKTKMSVFIASTSYGFAANIEYTYHVIYSS